MFILANERPCVTPLITPDVVWCNLRDSITNKHYYTISCHQPSEKTWTLSSKQNIIISQRRPENISIRSSSLGTGNKTNLLGLESRKNILCWNKYGNGYITACIESQYSSQLKVWTNIFHFLSDKTNHEINISLSSILHSPAAVQGSSLLNKYFI